MEAKHISGMTVDDAGVAGARRGKRERSKIEFPYSDLNAALELARTLLVKTGGAPCEDTQLASWMNQTASGGTFRTRVYAARMFGLIDLAQGSISLSPLGREALDETNSGGALVDAFLRVPLFNKLYEAYKGYALPTAAAIERQIESLGVSKKQTDRARQTFTKSAITAGFIDAQTGRFTKPAVAPGPPATDQRPVKSEVRGEGDGLDFKLDPLLVALLRKIPPKESGWPEDQRLRWFRTFAMNVSQVYDDNTAVDLVINVKKNDDASG
jgi:hypothetical protein